MNTSRLMVPADVYVTQLTEALADAKGEGAQSVDLLLLALRVCASPRVVAILRHADAIVRGAPRDTGLDAEAEALMPVVVRVMGWASAVFLVVSGESENRLAAALAEIDDMMEGYEQGAMLAGDDVWQELTDDALFPECGGSWWCSAYAEALNAPQA